MLNTNIHQNKNESGQSDEAWLNSLEDSLEITNDTDVVDFFANNSYPMQSHGTEPYTPFQTMDMGNDGWGNILPNTSDHTSTWASSELIAANSDSGWTSSAFDQGKWSPIEETITEARKEDVPLFDISSVPPPPPKSPPPNTHHRTRSKESVKSTESSRSKQSNPNQLNITKQATKIISREKDGLPIQNVFVETNDDTWIGSDWNPQQPKPLKKPPPDMSLSTPPPPPKSPPPLKNKHRTKIQDNSALNLKSCINSTNQQCNTNSHPKEQLNSATTSLTVDLTSLGSKELVKELRKEKKRNAWESRRDRSKEYIKQAEFVKIEQKSNIRNDVVDLSSTRSMELKGENEEWEQQHSIPSERKYDCGSDIIVKSYSHQKQGKTRDDWGRKLEQLKLKSRDHSNNHDVNSTIFESKSNLNNAQEANQAIQEEGITINKSFTSPDKLYVTQTEIISNPTWKKTPSGWTKTDSMVGDDWLHPYSTSKWESIDPVVKMSSPTSQPVVEERKIKQKSVQTHERKITFKAEEIHAPQQDFAEDKGGYCCEQEKLATISRDGSSTTQEDTGYENDNSQCEQTVTLPLKKLEEMLSDRVAKREQELKLMIHQHTDDEAIRKIKESEKEIARLQKEVDDLKFFQELNSQSDEDDEKRNVIGISPRNVGNISHRGSGTVSKLKSAERRLKELEKEVNDVRSENLELMDTNSALTCTVKDAGTGFLNTAEAYKANLRMKADLSKIRTQLQEEILAKECAETNLKCFKLESVTKLQELEEEHRKKIRDMEIRLRREILYETTGQREELEMRAEAVRLSSETKQREAEKKYKKLMKEQKESRKDLKEGVTIMQALENDLNKARNEAKVANAKIVEYEENIQMMEKQRRNRREEELHGKEKMRKAMEEVENRHGKEMKRKNVECDQIVERMKKDSEDAEMKRVEEVNKLNKLIAEAREKIEQVVSDSDAWGTNIEKDMEAKEMEYKTKIAIMESKHTNEMETIDGKLRITLADMQFKHTDELETVNKNLLIMTEKNNLLQQSLNKKSSKTNIDSEEIETMKREMKLKLRNHIEQEYMAREELKEALRKLDTAENNRKVLEQKTLKHYEELSDAKRKICELNDKIKTFNFGKLKDQQYMRDKKKWTMTDNRQRQEIAVLKKELKELRVGSRENKENLKDLEGAF